MEIRRASTVNDQIQPLGQIREFWYRKGCGLTWVHSSEAVFIPSARYAANQLSGSHYTFLIKFEHIARAILCCLCRPLHVRAYNMHNYSGLSTASNSVPHIEHAFVDHQSTLQLIWKGRMQKSSANAKYLDFWLLLMQMCSLLRRMLALVPSPLRCSATTTQNSNGVAVILDWMMHQLLDSSTILCNTRLLAPVTLSYAS